MYAIIEDGGRQYKVEEGQELEIDYRGLSVGEKLTFDQVLAYARRFVPPGKASKAVGLIKRSVQSGLEMSFGDALALERELQQQLFQSADSREGLEAYTEKRKARFEGR